MQTSVQEISNLIEPLVAAARADSSQLGHKVRPAPGYPTPPERPSKRWVTIHLSNAFSSQVSQMAQYFEPLTNATIGAASKAINHQQQMNLLDQTKTLAESALQMLYTAKEAGGNAKVSPEKICVLVGQDRKTTPQYTNGGDSAKKWSPNEGQIIADDTGQMQSGSMDGGNLMGFGVRIRILMGGSHGSMNR